MSLVLDQAFARLPHDDPGKEKQKRGLGKSRKSLHFTVPVVMLGIRRFAGKGLAGFLQKPYTAAALAAKIQSVLSGAGDTAAK